jgi:L-ascorbate metabolism protein UlaG (beta-lactamase superfamily)
LEITYLGDSSFRLRGKDIAVLTDPPQAGKLSADVITVSRTGIDEDSLPTGHVLRGPGEYEVAGVLIAGVATSRQPDRGATNTAYVLRFDDLAVCHLGHLRQPLTDNQVEELGSIDVLMVPAGGDGLTPAQAAEVVAQLEPMLVIPMSYRVNGAGEGMESVDHFCREMGVKEVTPEPKLNVSRGSLGQTVRVVVLEPKRV